MHCRFELVSQVISKNIFELLGTTFEVGKDRDFFTQKLQIRILSYRRFNLLVFKCYIDYQEFPLAIFGIWVKFEHFLVIWVDHLLLCLLNLLDRVLLLFALLKVLRGLRPLQLELRLHQYLVLGARNYGGGEFLLLFGIGLFDLVDLVAGTTGLFLLLLLLLWLLLFLALALVLLFLHKVR